MRKSIKLSLSGSAAGAVNGFFGSCGGMVLVPLLSRFLNSEFVFPSSMAIMLPICLTSLAVSRQELPWASALPYLIGSLAGGFLSRKLGKKLGSRWLHRGLGLLTILGGGRILWS